MRKLIYFLMLLTGIVSAQVTPIGKPLWTIKSGSLLTTVPSTLNVHIGNSGFTNTTSLGAFRVYKNSTFFDVGDMGGGYTGLWLNSQSPTATNFALTGNGSTAVLLNSPTDTADIFINAGNTNGFINLYGPRKNTNLPSIQLTAPTRQRITASANSPSMQFYLGSSQWLTGAIATNYGLQLVTPTWSSFAASTMAVGITFYAPSPTAGTNMTISNPYASAHGGNVGVNGKLEVGGYGSSGTLTSTLNVTGNGYISTTFTTNGAYTANSTISGASSILSSSKTGGIGYAVGSGSTVTQGTNRTTGVTINSITGSITLFSTAGSATYQSFTVTNSAVVATDVIKMCQKSGTDKYIILVTNVGAGSFQVTFATTGGTTSEAPVFNFVVIKGQTN